MQTPQNFRLAEEKITRFRECYQAIHHSMATIIIGQKDVIRLLSIGVMSGGHLLLVGVPGLAKTLMARVLAETLGWQYHRIQFTPDLMPSDITGTEILQSDESGMRRELIFHKGPLFANLVLADEINRTPPKTQAALLEAMQEQAVTVGGKTYQLPPPFVVIATQNPIEQEGTYPLPEAQLDRFFLSIHLGYPNRDEELAIAERPIRVTIPEMQPVSTPEEFHQLVQIVEDVPVSQQVLEYAVALTRGSRPAESGAGNYVRKYVNWGAGPRATQHLITAAKTAALLDGRPTPEIKDVQDMALPVLRHRIILNYKALGEGVDTTQVIRNLLEEVGESA